MPKKKIGPINVYPLLPKTNCGKCPPKVCMSFAVQLCERNENLEECPPLFEDQYRENLAQLQALLAPPVKEITLGTQENKVKIGGEMVLRRHELRYLHPTAIAIIVTDEMPDNIIKEKVKATEDFTYTYIGIQLKLDMIAVRSLSNDPLKFEKTVEKVVETTKIPLVLWSFDPNTLEQGVKKIQDQRPLLYAATKDNWREMGELAIKYRCPLTIYSPNDVKMLRSLSHTLRTMGVEDLTLDVGCEFGEEIVHTMNNMAMIRKTAISGEDEFLGYPIVGSPARIWDGRDSKEKRETVMWEEACLSSIMIIKYADLIMLSSSDMWTTLPLTILRNNIYNDPRKPVSVEPGLKLVADPDENSPVFFTSNFALTYYTVVSDIENIGSYLLIVDSEGTSVESAVAGRKLTAESIANAIKSSNIEEKIKHRTLIIPGMAARLKGEIEDETKWDVIVGPKDSSGIPGFLKDEWEGKDHTPGWSYK